jgi:WD40 repeat protein
MDMTEEFQTAFIHRDLLASASYDMTVRLWDVETGECRYILIGHSPYVMVVVYSPQGDQVASGDEGGSVRIWNTRTGECCHTFTGHTETMTGIVYSKWRTDHLW